jgi:hypothetical protein
MSTTFRDVFPRRGSWRFLWVKLFPPQRTSLIIDGVLCWRRNESAAYQAMLRRVCKSSSGHPWRWSRTASQDIQKRMWTRHRLPFMWAAEATLGSLPIPQQGGSGNGYSCVFTAGRAGFVLKRKFCNNALRDCIGKWQCFSVINVPHLTL